ncbi:hypothetical protein WICMUC_005112 [Wickerhamomyces mucosus]|uniref:Flavin-containing monooxygenase n=1 Tax=Wickerhamomyces mucosus TaxID=1378264 RepID=A0A9P8PD15_9ASCO|nr:hypothetical protein WICMUC_005112 [Wickerhamomyces mucosus]
MVESILIIGGGPCGAIALDSLLKEGFKNITLFERKNGFGGSWRADVSNDGEYTKPGATIDELDPPIKIPNVLPNKLPKIKQRRWIGSPALYPSLRTNVPERVMLFSDDPKFPYLDKPDQDELTTRDSVEKYVVNYVEKNKDKARIHTNTSVERILKKNDRFEVVWRRELEDEDEWQLEYFDAVIVATGHYNVPKIPYVDGIENFKHGKILHSKGFIADESFRNKRVIVIGARSSAFDSLREVQKFTDDIYWSFKETSNVFKEERSKAKPKTPRLPIIQKYTNDSVILEDGSIIEKPDFIIYGTGYHFSYPFLKEFDSNLTDDNIVNRTYEHIFYIDDPFLTFLGTQVDGISFRVWEYSAILIGRFFKGLIELPSKAEQLEWYENRIKQFGRTRNFHATVNDPALGHIAKLVRLGGGYEKLADGKNFPKFSEKDLEVYESNKRNLTIKWAEL